VEKIAERFGDRLRIVVKFAPYPYRDNAKFAARAALAARAQSAYWPMHHKMLEKSPTLDPASLLSYARELKLDADAFKKDLEADWTAARVEQDVALARSVDLYQTPTYVINGRVVVGNREFEYMEKVINEELAAAGVKGR
jgi:predicted DsbA family dithiol-disulfide isomerase